MNRRLRPGGLNRRAFNHLAAGATAAAAMNPGLAGVARAAAPAVPAQQSMSRAEQFGLNEAFKAMKFGNLSGAGWTRWTVQWFNVQQAPGELNVHYFRDSRGQSILEQQVNAGMKVAAMVLGTPEWAAETPGLKTGTSVPRGLYTPTMVGDRPNPENPWAVFMYELAKSYAGLMDVFEIWNEVEIPATGPNAVYNTWAGTAEQYFQLLKVASEAARSANPNAKIIVTPYSYFKDQQEGNGERLPWWDAFASAVRSANGGSLFDGIALNLYRNPHDLWDRMYGAISSYYAAADKRGFRERLADMGAPGAEIWLTEINAMPYDDVLPGWDPGARNDGFRITMNEQAAYVLQAHALAVAAGYPKIFFQALQDDPYPVGDELWGLVRYHDDPQNEDPSRARPAYAAYQMAAEFLGDADWADLYVRVRPDHPIDKFRQYASRWRWASHAVVAQKGDMRTYVIWSGSEEAQMASIQPWGAEARLFDQYRQEAPLRRQDGRYAVTVDRATRRFELFGGDPPGYFYVGGPPMVLVEYGVPPDAPVSVAGYVNMEKRPARPNDPDD
jgi:hypothetical protein